MITTLIITSIILTTGMGIPDRAPEFYKETLKNWKAAIIEHVEDDDREEKALEIITNAANSVKQSQEEHDTFLHQLMVVDARYEATMEDYEAIITSLAVIWRKNDAELIANRFELQETLTKEEWLVCFDDVKTRTTKYREKTKKKTEKSNKKRAKQVEELETNKKDAS